MNVYQKIYHVIVDISSLNIGDSLFAKDITLPEGVGLVTGEDHIIFSVAQQSVVETTSENSEESSEDSTEGETKKEEGSEG